MAVRGKKKGSAVIIDTRGQAGSYGSRYCICPECGHKTEHERGIPCSSLRCPKCGTQMRGERCTGS